MTPGIISDQFNQPPTDDNTSASPQPQLPSAQPLKPKKQGKLRNPAPLASAISRSKRARQFGQKWG